MNFVITTVIMMTEMETPLLFMTTEMKVPHFS